MLFSSESGCKPEGREESEREELPILIETEKQVTIAKGVHPVPCRTRKLSPSAPMVLRFASRESRSLPVSLFFYEMKHEMKKRLIQKEREHDQPAGQDEVAKGRSC